MGVPGLWPNLVPSMHIPLCRLADELLICDDGEEEAKSRRALIVGIDVSAWLYHATSSQGGANAALRLLLFRLLRLLMVPRLRPVFVFDGPGRPRMKRGASRHAQDWYGIDALKKLLDALGMQWIVAPGEAEAELAQRCFSGLVDVVLSDDVDSLVFGASIVIRNWSSGISLRGEQRDDVSEAPASSCTPSEVEEHPSGSSSRPASPRKRAGSPSKKKATAATGSAASVACFRTADLALDREGFILVALMAGGDYDVKGLVRCGAKIAMGLAAAGFGSLLVQGFEEHCIRPLRSAYALAQGLPAPKTKASWGDFRRRWIASLRDELRTNATGMLPKRYKVLADSQEMDELLATPQALAVLASYVWPLVSEAIEAAQRRDGGANEMTKQPQLATMPDLAHLVKILRVEMLWGEEACLRRCRSLIWEGIIVRQLEVDSDEQSRTPESMPETTVSVTFARQQRARPLYDSPTATRISDFFATSARIDSDPPRRGPEVRDETPSRREFSACIAKLCGIYSARDGPSGREIRTEWDVTDLVGCARQAISDSQYDWRAALAQRRQRGDDAPYTSSTEEAVSDKSLDSGSETRKRTQRPAKPIDHSATLRLWLPLELLERSPCTRVALRTWQAQQREKSGKAADAAQRRAERSARELRDKAGQRSVADFFGASRAKSVVAGPSTVGSPSKPVRRSAAALAPSTRPIERTGSEASSDSTSSSRRAAQTSDAQPFGRAQSKARSVAKDNSDLASSTPDRPLTDAELAAMWTRSPSPATRRATDLLLSQSGWLDDQHSNRYQRQAPVSEGSRSDTEANDAQPCRSRRIFTRTPPRTSSKPSERLSLTPRAVGEISTDLDESLPSPSTLMLPTSRAHRLQSTTKSARSSSPPHKSPRKTKLQESPRREVDAASASRRAQRGTGERSGATSLPSCKALAEVDSDGEEEEEDNSVVFVKAPPQPIFGPEGTRAGHRGKVRARLSQAILLDSDSDQ
ncbi:5'-3' exonuclease [Ceraceosorus bombacis]|uniref:5'-3' exonuclease n=1 Tax=Ceraceosorus bombacis TaxID=401625 RepID=A0A0P1BEV9_9BASI|nr:5'-3' exonuclease [Ceraceosorus bombacis]